MDRADYNNCMRPYITGSKPKEQRRLDFCVGAKICSLKASTREEAEEICRRPKTPKVVVNSKQQEVVKVTPPVNPKDISPMETWLADSPEGECRPCLLPPVIQWYREELEQHHPELVKEVDSAVHSGDASLIAWTFDSIKGKVPEKLQERLKEFDYHIQHYKGMGNDNASLG